VEPGPEVGYGAEPGGYAEPAPIVGTQMTSSR
jgi:hypothetical protein